MSWESSIEYERLINAEVRRRLGGTHSADLIIRSYDFAAIDNMKYGIAATRPGMHFQVRVGHRHRSIFSGGLSNCVCRGLDQYKHQGRYQESAN